MATYEELAGLRGDSRFGAFQHKVEAAIAIKAHAIATATPAASSAARTWAQDALRDPVGQAATLINFVIAANNTATVTQILEADDTGSPSIQEAVDEAVDTLFGAVL